MLEKDAFLKYIEPLSPLPTSMERSGMLEKKMKCILFDIYGTLFISGSGDIGLDQNNTPELSKIEQLLKESGFSIDAAEISEKLRTAIFSVHGKMKARGVDYPEVKIEDIWKDVLSVKDSEKVAHFAMAYEMIVNPVYPMPNLLKVLKKLRQKNISMGIISNAQFYTPYLFDWLIGESLQELQFDDELIFFSCREGVAKPSLHMFERAREKLAKTDISFDQVLYMGNDMRNDILPAKETGFKTALFAGDKRSLRLRNDLAKCRDIKPDLIVTDLIQLLDVV